MWGDRPKGKLFVIEKYDVKFHPTHMGCGHPVKMNELGSIPRGGARITK